MTQRKSDEDRAALLAVSDAIVDELFEASDEKILEEFRESFGDPAENAARMQQIYESARLRANKRKLNAAKAGVSSTVFHHNVTRFTLKPEHARAAMKKLIASGALEGCTLAARDEKELSDEDILSTLQELYELGVISAQIESE